MKVQYSVRLKPDAVPDGEMVKCWLPYPRQDNRRQTSVELLSVSEPDYVIAPNDYAHRTIYMQKKHRKGSHSNLVSNLAIRPQPNGSI